MSPGIAYKPQIVSLFLPVDGEPEHASRGKFSGNCLCDGSWRALRCDLRLRARLPEISVSSASDPSLLSAHSGPDHHFIISIRPVGPNAYCSDLFYRCHGISCQMVRRTALVPQRLSYRGASLDVQINRSITCCWHRGPLLILLRYCFSSATPPPYRLSEDHVP